MQLLLVSTALDDAAQIPMGIVWINEKATSVLLVNQEQFDLRLTELIRDVVLRQQIQSVPEDRNRSNAAAIQARVHLVHELLRVVPRFRPHCLNSEAKPSESWKTLHGSEHSDRRWLRKCMEQPGKIIE